MRDKSEAPPLKKPNATVSATHQAPASSEYILCLECHKILGLAPIFAQAVLDSDGVLKGYIHPLGDCKANWLTKNPGDRYEQI